MNNHHTFSAAVLIIRLNPDAATAIWRLAAPGDAAQTGEWHPDAGDPTLSCWRSVIRPGCWCPPATARFIALPCPPARAKQQQALAFLLEEQLATEIEESHFALIHRDKSDCAVAVVGREKMRAWQAWCEGSD
jgi:general secretion pathway protein L